MSQLEPYFRDDFCFVLQGREGPYFETVQWHHSCCGFSALCEVEAGNGLLAVSFPLLSLPFSSPPIPLLFSLLFLYLFIGELWGENKSTTFFFGENESLIFLIVQTTQRKVQYAQKQILKCHGARVRPFAHSCHTQC